MVIVVDVVVVLLKYSFYSAAQLFTYLSCFRCIDMLCHDIFLFPSLKQQIFFDIYKLFLFDSGIAASISGELSGEEVARVCIETKADIILVQNEQILKKVIYSP